MNAAGRDLQTLFSVGALGGLSDGQLLERFVGRRDEAAFEALVRRHGPMVWGVCRRVLRNHHDAEDAFQATFLVLVRKAASIAPTGDGRQLALRRGPPDGVEGEGDGRQAAGAGEAGDGRCPNRAAAEQDLWDDLQPLLDEELSRLPDNYRVRHRPVRPGGQDPQGSGPATRRARRDGGEAAGEGEGDAGEAARPAGCRLVGRGAGGGAVAEGGVGGRADLGGVVHDQGRKPVCGGAGGGGAWSRPRSPPSQKEC